MSAMYCNVNAIANEIGARHGYEEVELEATPFRDIKIKWTWSYRWISIELCDYFLSMPEDAARDLFERFFAALESGEGTEALFGGAFGDWVASDLFRESQRDVYYDRMHLAGERESGDLADMRDELIRMGILNDAGIDVRWSPAIDSRASPVFRVAMIAERYEDAPLRTQMAQVAEQCATIEIAGGRRLTDEGRRAVRDRMDRFHSIFDEEE